jgi:hypothetical protein
MAVGGEMEQQAAGKTGRREAVLVESETHQAAEKAITLLFEATATATILTNYE